MFMLHVMCVVGKHYECISAIDHDAELVKDYLIKHIDANIVKKFERDEDEMIIYINSDKYNKLYKWYEKRKARIYG